MRTDTRHRRHRSLGADPIETTNARPSDGPAREHLVPIPTRVLLGVCLLGGAINVVGLCLLLTPFDWLSVPLIYGSAYIALMLFNPTIALCRRWARHRS